MKKMLITLSSLSLLFSSANTVISCKSNDIPIIKDDINNVLVGLEHSALAIYDNQADEAYEHVYNRLADSLGVQVEELTQANLQELPKFFQAVGDLRVQVNQELLEKNIFTALETNAYTPTKDDISFTYYAKNGNDFNEVEKFEPVEVDIAKVAEPIYLSITTNGEHFASITTPILEFRLFLGQRIDIATRRLQFLPYELKQLPDSEVQNYIENWNRTLVFNEHELTVSREKAANGDQFIIVTVAPDANRYKGSSLRQAIE